MISSFHLPESSANARRISSCMLISSLALVWFSILAATNSSYLRISILDDIFDGHWRRGKKAPPDQPTKPMKEMLLQHQAAGRPFDRNV